jgi:Domain of Unknown Function with PDB structure (DUF3857)/Transglutaminase-like superfamily
MTALRSCSRLPSRSKTISRAALLATSVTGLLFWLPSLVRADSAPDWLRAAAQEKLPAYSSDPVAVVLLDELETTAQANGEIDTRHRFAYKLLRPEARDQYGFALVQFDNETKVKSFKAWTITKDGHELSLSEKDAIETALSGDALFSDNRAKVLRFAEANPGNVVGYEYVQKSRPFVFENDWEFQDKIPVLHARFLLDLPPGWEFTSSWFNYPEQKPQVSGSNHYLWELRDIPAMAKEPEMPPWNTIAGWVGVKYFPSDPSQRPKTTGAWKDIGQWYSTLTAPSRVASPQIKQKVAELTSGLSDPLARIRALTDYMQRQVRYVAIEVGIGGFQPHPAADVFSHQYGDCKDKVTLLSSMLQEIGIESYYVIVDSDRGVVRAEYPSLHFDHVILAIQLPPDASQGGLYAIVKDPKLGSLLIFDPTDPYVPLGYLPWQLQTSYALLVAPDGGTLIQMPLLPPSTNRLLRTGKFTITAEGGLTADVQELEWGGPASEEREQFLSAQPSRRAEIFDGFLGQFLANFTLLGASLENLERYDQSLLLNYKFNAAGYATAAGDMLLVRPRVLGDQYTSLLTLFSDKKPRQYPIEFKEATRQDDIFDITVPAGYVPDGLPRPLQADCDYATYKSETTFSNGVLHYKRTFEIKQVMVPQERLSAIRDFLAQVAADQQAAAILRRVTP